MKRPVLNPSWNDEVRRLYEHDMEEMWDATITPHMYMRYHYLLDFYMSLAESTRSLNVLDVGCAQGTLALLLAEQGHRVTAVDIRADFLDYAATRYTHGDIQFIAGNLFEEDLLTETYDLVYANQIIEHVLQPEEKIKRLSEYLAAGGRLVMTTPNHAYFRNPLPTYPQFLEFGLHFDENSADADGHVFAFELGDLVERVKAAGLRVLRSGYLETPLINGHFKVRHLIPYVNERVLKAIDSKLATAPKIAPHVAHQLYVVACK